MKTTNNANKMILATLKTKMTKPAKYEAELKELGYNVLTTDNSAQGYWEVECEKTGNRLAISKSYQGKVTLYGTKKRGSVIVSDNLVPNSELAKFNYEGYLNTVRYEKLPREYEVRCPKTGYWTQCSPVVREYRKIAETKQSASYWMDKRAKEIEELQKELALKQEYMKQEMEKLQQAHLDMEKLKSKSA